MVYFYLIRFLHARNISQRALAGKTTAVRLIAVRETGVSRHHGGPIEGPPETPRTSEHYRL